MRGAHKQISATNEYLAPSLSAYQLILQAGVYPGVFVFSVQRPEF